MSHDLKKKKKRITWRHSEKHLVGTQSNWRGYFCPFSFTVLLHCWKLDLTPSSVSLNWLCIVMHFHTCLQPELTDYVIYLCNNYQTSLISEWSVVVFVYQYTETYEKKNIIVCSKSHTNTKNGDSLSYKTLEYFCRIVWIRGKEWPLVFISGTLPMVLDSRKYRYLTRPLT